MMPQKGSHTMTTQEGIVRRDKRARVEKELRSAAYTLHNVKPDEYECGGWFEMRGVFATLAWTVGAWDKPEAPDHINDAESEQRFQTVLALYNERGEADTARWHAAQEGGGA